LHNLGFHNIIRYIVENCSSGIYMTVYISNDEIIDTNYEVKNIQKFHSFSLQLDFHMHVEVKFLTKFLSHTWIYITHLIIYVQG
jgi:hypothetical protein